MQYELRQQVIEPLRPTFQNLVDRYGERPATRYEEGSIDIQATENFHYRPLWDPEHELYDPDYSALKLTDPYDFTDPRQYYYAPYVTNRAALHEAFGNTLDYIDERKLLDKLPEGWRTVLGDVVLPLRHYESGAQLLSVNGARFSYGTTVAQCLAYAGFDRVGLAQLLSRLGLGLADGSAEQLTRAKNQWLEGEHLQDLRRLVEELLIEPDWVTGTWAVDLLDQVLYPLLWRHLDDQAILQAAGAYSLLAQHMTAWFADHRRWWDALVAAWLADEQYGESNRTALAEIATTWLPKVESAAQALAGQIDAQVDAGAVEKAGELMTDLRGRLAEQGILTGEVAR